MGLAIGLTLVPTLGVIVHHFLKTNRALATGIALSGGGCGGIVFPICEYLRLPPVFPFTWTDFFSSDQVEFVVSFFTTVTRAFYPVICCWNTVSHSQSVRVAMSLSVAWSHLSFLCVLSLYQQWRQAQFSSRLLIFSRKFHSCYLLQGNRLFWMPDFIWQFPQHFYHALGRIFSK